jgi:hypothetical protein
MALEILPAAMLQLLIAAMLKISCGFSLFLGVCGG